MAYIVNCMLLVREIYLISPMKEKAVAPHSGSGDKAVPENYLRSITRAVAELPALPTMRMM
jgi:hypothetical protein